MADRFPRLASCRIAVPLRRCNSSIDPGTSENHPSRNPCSSLFRPKIPCSESPGKLVRGAKLVAVSTCHGRLVPAISIIGVCAFRYRTFAGLYSYNFVSQDSDVGQRHLSKTKYP